MREKAKEFAKTIFNTFDIGFVRKDKLKQLELVDSDLGIFFDSLLKKVCANGESKSQLKQDIFVLLQTEFKKKGYFVEFGATNGIEHSNTYLLEKEFSWNGILAEPARCWHDDLNKNRCALISNKCVWRKSGEFLEFNMTSDAELSTIADFNNRDNHYKSRTKGTSYQVETISLLDLLITNKAPRTIDYLSIDTEGSEFEILSAFDFDKYDIKIITCEHNYTDDREKIYRLLTGHGYERIFEGLSKWDDWYVRL